MNEQVTVATPVGVRVEYQGISRYGQIVFKSKDFRGRFAEKNMQRWIEKQEKRWSFVGVYARVNLY
jgi:hypothetical protein